jgi:hypothetical protein
MDASTITWLILGALILSALAVVLDRVNFPQKPFRARQIVTVGDKAPRDRTGAHIVDESGEELPPAGPPQGQQPPSPPPG